MFIKWSSLHKSVSKFTPKKFYEIYPRKENITTQHVKAEITWEAISVIIPLKNAIEDKNNVKLLVF